VFPEKQIVFRCPHCFSVYDSSVGDAEQNIEVGTGFENLPEGYCCTLCEAPKEEFVEVEETASVDN